MLAMTTVHLCAGKTAMATLTIRNLDDRLKSRLRVQAATRGRSMEEEARQILRSVLDQPEPAPASLAERIRHRFAKLGDVELPIADREPVRYLDIPGEVPANRAATPTRAGAGKTRRRT
jgi:plasmid stability protein